MRHLATYAIAVAMGAALFTPTGHVLAGPGECLGEFSSAKIDEVATQIGLSSLAEADLSVLICNDDPAVPAIALLAEPFDKSLFSDFTAQSHPYRSSGDWNMGLTVVIAAYPIGKPSIYISETLRGVEGEEPTEAQKHICRAEVLRSFTWRRLCANNVDRLPN